jgi:hypothetical protein
MRRLDVSTAPLARGGPGTVAFDGDLLRLGEPPGRRSRGDGAPLRDDLALQGPGAHTSGATAFTRTPCTISSSAAAIVKPRLAAVAAE